MVSKKLKKIRTYAILLCMLYRTPRSLTFTLAILFISFSLAGVIAPSLFIAEPLIHSPGFLFPVVGLVLFWGLFLLTMDWLPLQKSFRRVCTGINFSVCVLLFVLSIWAGKNWNSAFFLAAALNTILAEVIISSGKSISLFLRLSNGVWLFSISLFIFQQLFLATLPFWELNILSVLLAIFVLGLLFTVLTLVIKSRSNFQRIVQSLISLPWFLFFAILLLTSTDSGAAFFAGVVGLTSLLTIRMEKLLLNETRMTGRAIFIGSMVITGMVLLVLVTGIFLYGSTSLSNSFLLARWLSIIVALAVVSIPVLIFVRVLSAFKSQFESIFQLSQGMKPQVAVNQEASKPMLAGGSVTALTQGYSSLVQRSDSLTKIRQNLTNQTLERFSKPQQGDITSLVQLSEMLETTLEIPVAAQLLVVSLQKAISCDICMIFTHSPDEHRLIPIASAGPDMAAIPARFRLKMNEGDVESRDPGEKIIIGVPRKFSIRESPFNWQKRIYIHDHCPSSIRRVFGRNYSPRRQAGPLPDIQSFGDLRGFWVAVGFCLEQIQPLPERRRIDEFKHFTDRYFGYANLAHSNC